MNQLKPYYSLDILFKNNKTQSRFIVVKFNRLNKAFLANKDKTK